MTDFDAPTVVVHDLVAIALREDLGALGDLTTVALVGPDVVAAGEFRSRKAGIVAGTEVANEVFRQLDARVGIDWKISDGEVVEAGSTIGTIHGPMRAILGGERTALNFLGHLSGIATSTRAYVDVLNGRARVRDTRKTLPGLRALQKAAVRAGGGFSHRESLSDALVIKDNHLVGVTMREAIEITRDWWPGRWVEVECETLEQVAEAKAAGADLVMVDNMTPDEVREAVRTLGGSGYVEISGGITLDNVASYADTGADFVSIGAITHSALNLDIGLDLVSRSDGAPGSN